MILLKTPHEQKMFGNIGQELEQLMDIFMLILTGAQMGTKQHQ